MGSAECGLLDHLVVELAFEVHHELEHLVITSARKQNLAREELVQCTADGPDIDRSVER